MTSTIAIMYAVEIHVISWMLAPSSPRIFGSATLTIDESIVAISDPNAIDTATSHLLTGALTDGGSEIAVTLRSRARTYRPPAPHPSCAVRRARAATTSTPLAPGGGGPAVLLRARARLDRPPAPLPSWAFPPPGAATTSTP